MDLWQQTMIGLARSARVKRAMQHHGGATALARRFVVVGGPEAAVAAARRLRDRRGISASLAYLGEYVSDPALIERTVDMALTVTRLLGEADLDVQVSADPTAIGELASPQLCRDNAERIARAVAAQPAHGRNFLMLDMEDLSLVEPTLHLQRELFAEGLPAAVTLQARLRRTARDIETLVPHSPAIRLVKGAFPLGPEHDHQGRVAIARSFLSSARTMLAPEVRETDFHPVFATHDEGLIRRIAEVARRIGWRQEEYEFELLYGVRPDLARRLRAEGFSVRLYLPFGTDWWPYAIRRVGEHPHNALLLVRSLVSGNRAGTGSSGAV
jgi:proline dehydrogenase